MLFKKNLLISIFLFCIAQPSPANAILGGDLGYQWLNGDNYRIHLTLYGDCTQSNLFDSYQLIIESVMCSYIDTIDIFENVGNSGNEVLLTCSSEITTCNGGSTPGVRQYIYEWEITLPMNCPDWILSVTPDNGDWRSDLNNLENTPPQKVRIQATLDNTLAVGNSSPIFNKVPIVQYCNEVSATFDHLIEEADGDSLAFTMIAPMTENMVSMNFVAPLTAANPLFSSYFNVDPISGTISLIPDGVQFSAIALLVEEYRNGLKIGSTMRYMQIGISACTNTQPVIEDTPAIYTVCPGDNLTFSIDMTDTTISPGSMLVVTQMTNAPAIFAASTINIMSANQAIFDFNWTPTLADTGLYTFTIKVTDDECPVVAFQERIIQILVHGTVNVGPDITYCPANGIIDIEATGGDSFTWASLPFDNSLVESNNGQIGSMSPSETTTYTVTSNCGTSDQVMVNVVPDFPITATGNSTICSGENTALMVETPDMSNYTIVWSPATGLSATDIANPTASPTVTTDYTVEVTSNNTGCTITDQVTVTVPSTLSAITLMPEDTVTLCTGDSLLLEAAIVENMSGGAITYNWTPNTGLSSPDALTTWATPSTTTAYTFTAQDAFCSLSQTILVEVQEGFSLTMRADTSICEGENVQLYLNGTATNDLQYVWTPANFLTCADCPMPVATPTETTVYTVTISNSNGCIDTYEVELAVSPLPSVEVGEDRQIFKDTPIQLTAQGSFDQIVWMPTQGLSDPNSATPDLYIEEAGIYTATVSNALGCTTSDMLNVRYGACADIMVPTAFSPNEDGLNDTFGIVDVGIDELIEFKVFNRWGGIVFDALDITDRWDGTYKFKTMPTGVYVYYVTALCDGAVKQAKGQVTLIR